MELSEVGRGYPSVASVNLSAIARNLAVLRAASPTTIQMAIVKANAYGHGLIPVALASLKAGAQWLGVAQLAEALELRAGLDEAGIARKDAPIFAWISSTGTDFSTAIEADIDLSVSWTWVLDEIRAAARALGRPARVHVKIDTGMSRAGSTLADLPELAQALREAQDQGLIEIVGAWSHMSRADDPSPSGEESTRSHVKIFEEGLRILAQAGVRPKIRHLAATSGILWHPETHYDMVRVGIGMYGLSPDPSVKSARQLGIEAAMTLSAPLTSVKVIEEGTPASYGGTWQAPTRRWIGLVPLGYGDGILRACSNGAPVVVETERGLFPTQIIGRVCMDQFMIDLGPAEGEADTPTSASGRPPARVGERALLFGDPEKGCPSADKWAIRAGTINYEIVTRLGERIPRDYQYEEER